MKREIDKLAKFDEKYYQLLKEIYIIGWGDGFDAGLKNLLYNRSKKK
ncbi:MAG: hypothetical protein ACFFDN_02670 [Candidatus Hodarchaeota archaeon]